jgi:hypothetical protein
MSQPPENYRDEVNNASRFTACATAPAAWEIRRDPPRLIGITADPGSSTKRGGHERLGYSAM